MFDVGVDPANSMNVYLVDGPVYKSIDGGSHWAPAVSGLPSPTSAISLAVDSSNPLHVFIGTYHGVFETFDGAQSWTPASSGLAYRLISVIRVSPSSPTHVYAGTWAGGVFRSLNGGMLWTPVNRGLVATHVQAITVDSGNPTTMYLGMAYGGAWKSADAGMTWALSSVGMEERIVFSLAVDSSAPATVYAGASDGVYKSTNAGASWFRPSGSPPGGIGSVAVDPGASQTIFAASNSRIFKSVDGGVTWSQKASSGGALAIDPSTPSRLYAATHSGLAKSTDGGETWSKTGPAAYLVAVKIDPTNPAVLYSVSYAGDGVLKSHDYGVSWTQIKEPASQGFYYDLAIDPQRPSTLYLATTQGVSRSSDGGASWSSFSHGLPDYDVEVIAVDPTGHRLYAGPYARGMFAYEFSFYVTGITPTAGPGGTPVTITGAGFEFNAGVTIGGVPATSVVVHGTTMLTAVAPALGLGALYDVVVTNPGGAQAILPKAFLADASSARAPISGTSRRRSKSLPARTPE